MKRAAVVIVSVLLVVAACVPRTPPTATPVPASPPQTTAPPSVSGPGPKPAAPAIKPAWEVEWESTVEAAKREGRVTIYTAGGGRARAEVQKAFTEKFGISTEYLPGRTGEVAEKILAERRVGLNFGDICQMTPSTILPRFKPKGILEKLDSWLILPEVTDPKQWRFGDKLRWADADHTAFPAIAYVVNSAAINTNLVKTEEMQSFRDLLNPKWKGKIISDDPTTDGPAFTYWPIVGEKLMGWDFVQQFLANQSPIISRDWRLEAEWLAQGKVAVGLALQPETIQEFISLGAPIKLVVFKEGSYASSGNGVIGGFANPPHPNAAKVFANWFLSREGQIAAVRGFGLPSGRLDVPAEGIDPVRVPQAGVKYVWIDQEDWITEAAPLRQKNADIFKAAMRK